MDLPMIVPDSETHLNNHKTICIIGGGPAGLAALKIILDTPQYKAGIWSLTAFEARNDIGGVWLPAPPTGAHPPLTPLYDSLTTNLPHPVMAFTSYSFPPSTPLFPQASTVLRYLADYADHFDLRRHVQFNTEVTTVVRDASCWKVTVSTGDIFTFDLVIVCNGHYRIPRYPDTPGIVQWLASGRASHSAWYRHPRQFGDVVLVVGGGPSGMDISAEMCAVTPSVIHSYTGAAHESEGNLKRLGRPTRFGDNGEVTFEDGTTESGISHCILATGYDFSFPFLESDILHLSFPPSVPPLPKEAYNSRYHIFPLARQMFPLQNAYPPSSIAFLGVLYGVAPFPLLEAQVRTALHAFVHPQSLDPVKEAVDIMTRHEELKDKVGDNPLAIAKAWHRFHLMDQYDYRDALYELCTNSQNGSELLDGWTKVPMWEKEMYSQKLVLRKAWLELEKREEADRWVRGVGEGGPHEWVEMTRRLIKWAKERGVEAIASKPRL